ncbi:EfeM/EfeO family lipoprotein [Streptomyces sp. NPDC058045]|uniref:EfeM/EfeO family lipoprotein n=1 Tax=Streptomyces sp. NPDC058045 TaxID=3346311 RepID=UPI0036E473AB
MLVAGAMLAACALLLGCLAAAGAFDRDSAPADPTGADGLRHTAVEITLGDCGGGVRDAHPGRQVFDVHSGMERSAEVQLVEVRTGTVHGELDGLAPGTTRPLHVALGNGTYRLRCLPDDAEAVNGPALRVTGAGTPGGPAAVPLDQHDLIPPTIAYQRWVGRQMSRLARATGTLRTAIRRGDLPAARTAWLTAHLRYERLGAAYGAFGDADQAINGTDAGLPKGVHDPGFTGFHRLEQGLWHGESAHRLRPVADRLVREVRTLRTTWSQVRMDPLDLGLRAHEILENTLESELSGRTDFGSGSNLATARANLDGTRAVLRLLRPLLTGRYPRLKDLDASLDRFGDRLDSQHRHGSWTPLDRLGTSDRRRLNAATGDTVERLAEVAALCDVRRTA